MGGTRAIWNDGWKAVAISPSAPDAWADYATQEWELFDCPAPPQRVSRHLRRAPGEAAGAHRPVVDLGWPVQRAPAGESGVVEILGTERPQIPKPRDRYIYYPGCAEVPESVAPNIRNRSYTIAVEAEIETSDASGMLFSPRRSIRRSRALPQGREAQVRLQLGRHAGTDRRVDRYDHHRPPGLVGDVRARGRHHARRGDSHPPHWDHKRSARAGSKPNRASSPSPGKVSTSAKTAASRLLTTTPVPPHGRSWEASPDAPSSTSAAIRLSTSLARRQWPSPETEPYVLPAR